MMEEGREDVMEEEKEMRMELRVMREDIKAMRRSLKEVEKLVRKGLTGTREERKDRRERGMERIKGVRGESKEETPKKLMLEKSRWREERRKEVGWRTVEEPTIGGKIREEDLMEGRREERRVKKRCGGKEKRERKWEVVKKERWADADRSGVGWWARERCTWTQFK